MENKNFTVITKRPMVWVFKNPNLLYRSYAVSCAGKPPRFSSNEKPLMVFIKAVGADEKRYMLLVGYPPNFMLKSTHKMFEIIYENDFIYKISFDFNEDILFIRARLKNQKEFKNLNLKLDKIAFEFFQHPMDPAVLVSMLENDIEENKEIKTTFYYIFDNFKNLISTPKGCFYFIIGFFWVIIYICLFFWNFTGIYFVVDFKNNIHIFIFLFLLNSSKIFNVFFGHYIKFFNFWKKLTVFFDHFFLFPLNSIYKIIEREIPGSGYFFFFLERRYFTCSLSRGGKSERFCFFTYLFILIFDVLPKVIVAITFFIDIVFLGQIKYFFYLLPILFLPILLKIFLNLIRSFANNSIYILYSTYFVGIKPFGKEKLIYDGSFKIYESYWIEVKPEYSTVINPLEELKRILALQNMLMQVYFIKKEMKIFSTPTILITSILYVIVSLYWILF